MLLSYYQLLIKLQGCQKLKQMKAKQSNSNQSYKQCLKFTLFQICQTSSSSNQTLVGLAEHIQLSLSQVIEFKKSLKYAQDPKQQLQVLKLIQIQQEFANLTANINRYLRQKCFNYELSVEDNSKKGRTVKTNHSRSPQPTKEQFLTDVQMEVINLQLKKTSKMNSLIKNDQSNKQNIMNFDNFAFSQGSLNKVKDLKSQIASLKQIQKLQVFNQIRPFQLIQYGKEQQINTLEDDQLRIDFGIARQEKNQTQNLKHLKPAKHQDEFSPICLGSVSEEPLQHQMQNMTFFPKIQIAHSTAPTRPNQVRNDRFYIKNHQPVLPARYPRRKYNYLEKANQR